MSSSNRGPSASVRRLGAGAVALALALTGCGTGDEAADDLRARLAEAEQQRDDARARASELEEENERLEAEVSALAQEVEGEPDEPDEPDEPAEPHALSTPEALTEQLRLHFGHGDLPEDFEPGTTGWSAFDLPAEAQQETYDTPGDAASAALTELEGTGLGQEAWEATVRVLLDPEDQDRADAAVLSWGWADDAVIGRDVRISLIRTDEGEWRMEDAEARHHCLRGVSDDDLCV